MEFGRPVWILLSAGARSGVEKSSETLAWLYTARQAIALSESFPTVPNWLQDPKYFSAPGFAPANRKIQIVRQTNQSPCIDKVSNLWCGTMIILFILMLIAFFFVFADDGVTDDTNMVHLQTISNRWVFWWKRLLKFLEDELAYLENFIYVTWTAQSVLSH